jgi:hypothetical protein
MKTNLITLALAALTFSSTLRADELTHPPINPALLYWQTAALLPKLTDDRAKDLRAMATGNVPFDATKAKDLLPDKSSQHMLQKAANSAAPCDWGLPTEDGPYMALPHTSKMMEMAYMAVLEAESSFADGQIPEGLNWLIVAHRMARHAGAGDLLITNLVQFAIEANAMRAAAHHCLNWDEQTRQAYAATLESLPPLHTTQKAYRGEQMYTDWMEHQFQMGGKAEIEKLRQVVANSGGSPIKPEDKAALESNLEPAAFHAGLAEWRSLIGQIAAAIGKPWPQAQPELQKLNDEATHSSYYLVRSGIPAIVGVAEKQYVIATMHTMLDAVLKHGSQLDEATAANYHDSFAGEPLHFQKNDGTLILATAHEYRAGKTVSLQFGK